MIIDATHRGATITRRLLAFARKDELQAEAIDVPALMAEVPELLRHTIGSAIEFRMQSAAGLPNLWADKGQLETVLINLATNARDAMPSGGTLTISAAEGQMPGWMPSRRIFHLGPILRSR